MELNSKSDDMQNFFLNNNEVESSVPEEASIKETISVGDTDSRCDSDESYHHHHSHHSHHHSHHHSGHHSGRHSGSRRRNNKDNKLVSFVKKNKYLLIIICLCVVIIALLVALAMEHDNKKETEKDTNDNNAVVLSESSVKIELSLFTKEVSIASKAVEKYISSVNSQNAHDYWRDNQGSSQRLDVGLPVKISYNVSGLPKQVTVIKTVLEISENSTFVSCREISTEEKSNVVDVYHLKTGTKYYYRVTAELSSGTSVNSSGSFFTKETPRMMKIDGAVNVRDIGGWETVDGKIIRQGLLYRGSELDGAVEEKYCITEQAKNDMLSILGIRSDMDLRAKEETPKGKDILGENVEHIYYGIPMYSDLLDDNAKEKVRNIFSYLSDEHHYPLYMHCTYGRDRTGTVCYLLEALLGMSDADLKKEYDLSAIYDGYANYEAFATLVNDIKHLEGDTTQEKVENYLLSVGVTAEEIESIRNIFLEEVK